MNRLNTATLVVLLVLVVTTLQGVRGFSFGQLFPASRRGVRGSLLGSVFADKTTSNALKEALKQAATKETKIVMPSSTTTTTTTTTTPTTRKKPSSYPITNSPIYYIRLPPSPYVYMPGLGYVSPNNNKFDFLRPEVNFINNGKPSNIFHFKAPPTPTKAVATTTTTTVSPTSSTAVATTTTLAKVPRLLLFLPRRR
nr:protein let-653-like [Cherax quadricarinatus]